MNIDIIGMPLNLGCNKLGVEKGFSVLRNSFDLKDIFSSHSIQIKDEMSCPSFDEIQNTDLNMKNRDYIFKCNEELAEMVSQSISNERFPLIIGGDHSMSWGSISGVARHYNDLGCIYIDAHGDFNPAELSPSKNVHGMHMAYLMGLVDSPLIDLYDKGIKLDKNEVHFIGTRSLDFGEKELASKYNLDIKSSEDVFVRGIEDVTKELLEKISKSNKKHFHISLDIDVIDPMDCPGTGVPEKDGLKEFQVSYLVRNLLSTGKIVSMDLVEFNPSLDIDDKTLKLCGNFLKDINIGLGGI